MKEFMVIDSRTNECVCNADEHELKALIRDLEYKDIVHGTFEEDAYIVHDLLRDDKEVVSYYSRESHHDFVVEEICKVVRRFVAQMKKKHGIEFTTKEYDIFEESTLDAMTDDDYHMDFLTLRTSYYDWLISQV